MPLLGVPIIHKDIFCTKDIRTTCASKMLDNFIPPYSATIVERLEKAGCVLLGKANMDEFAMGSSTEHSHYGATKNPWNTNCVSGGSSGGSAAAVAADFCLAATGSDTGGSIRQPAAFCGVTGLKPTYGRIPRWGMIAYASSLDTAGFFSHSSEDLAKLLSVVAGKDDKDSTASNKTPDNYTSIVNDKTLQVKTLGIATASIQKLPANIAKHFENTIKYFESLGIEIKEVDVSDIDDAISAYYIIACAEASSNLSRYDGVRYGHRSDDSKNIHDMYCNSRSEGFGREVKKRILSGTHVLSADFYDAYYLRALRVRRLIKESFLKLFSGVDAMLMPVTPNVAFDLNSKSDADMYLEDSFTVPMNLSGVPALSMPIGHENGMPVAAQLVGSYFSEGKLLQLSNKMQQDTEWHKLKPNF